MVNAVIFDLDGTLLNTLEDLRDSCNHALEKFGFPARTTDEVRQFVGNGISKLMERAIPNGKENPQFEKCLLELKNDYAKNYHNKTKAYSGVIDAIKKLKDFNLKIGIVSNKPDAQVKELAELYFSDCITKECAVGERLGIQKKPSPDSLNEVMRLLKVQKENVIYVGDSDVDIETAKNAKTRCISVSWGFRSKEFLMQHNASLIVNNTEELLDAIFTEKI